jgi:fructokinase
MSDVVVVGEALVDLVISPDGDVEAALGGAPFNTARTCGRLGVDVSYVGAVSVDRFGSMIRRQLMDDGVAVDGVITVEAPTTLAAAELDSGGAASYRFYIDGTSAPAVGRVAPPSPRPGIVFTGGLALVLEPLADAVAAMISGSTSGSTSGAGVDRRPLVVIDVNCRPAIVADRQRYLDRLHEVLTHTDVVKVSDDDLTFLARDEAPLSAARSLLDRGPSVVLLTTGGGSVTVLTADVERTVPVSPVEVVDTIGAGDAFIGGFCSWWTATGRTRRDLADVEVLERAVRAANEVAGVVCTRRGADPPWRHELGDDWTSARPPDPLIS